MSAWRSRAAWSADAPALLAAETAAVAALEPGLLRGRCTLCGSQAGFARAADGRDDWREGLACRGCGCNARQRAAAHVLLDSLASAATARVFATEHASALFLALRRRVGRLDGGEFAPAPLRRLRLALWLLRHGASPLVRHRDATALPFGEDSLDAILSLDVLEHVPDAQAALREFARVLRAGGALVLTVPFHADRDAGEAIARRRADGGIEHFGEPEFHGDPLGGGVPCFHHFAWDLLDRLRDAGFRDAEALRVRDPARGLPVGQWVLRARR